MPKQIGRPPKREADRATSQIQMRTTGARKAAYVRAAHPRKLSEWITEQLDKASGYRQSAE